MSSLKIGLTGANGFVGSHIAESCLKEGFQLTCLLRKSSDTTFIRDLIYNRITGDINDENALSRFVPDQNIIIHNAGLTKARNESEFMEVNTNGTKNILNAILKFNPNIRRFILISSQAAVGPTPSKEPLDESIPKKPITAYGRSKALAEEICQKYSNKIPITIIRPPVVFGPRDKDIYEYFRIINKGIQPVIGKENTFSVVSIQNLVKGILLSIHKQDKKLECYFITDEGDYTWDQFSSMISYKLNKKPIKIKIPNWIVLIFASINEVYSKIFKKAVLLNREKIKEMKQKRWVVSSQKATNELGYKPIITTKQAIAITVEWYKKNEWL